MTAISTTNGSTDNEQIHIEQLEVSARVGVTEQELSRPQRLTVTITAWPSKPFAEMRDDIGQTVNYSALCVVVREFVEEHPHRLIETLVDAIAVLLLQTFPLRKIQIELRKFVLPDAAFVAVQVTKSAGADQ